VREMRRAGLVRIEMHFLRTSSSLRAVQGPALQPRDARVKFKDRNISEVLRDRRGDWSFSKNQPVAANADDIRCGLGYIRWAAARRSPGARPAREASTELGRRGDWQDIVLAGQPRPPYFADIKTVDVLHPPGDGREHVLVIEHNMDVINSDHIIDLAGIARGRLSSKGRPRPWRSGHGYGRISEGS